MKRIITILLFSFIVLPVLGQKVYVHKGYPENIPSYSYYLVTNDPVADFIEAYAPSYFFQEVEILDRSNINMTVRTFYNYNDSKCLSQIILTTESGEVLRENTRSKVDDYYIWESIDADEVDSILAFLSSVAPLKVRYDDPMTRVYNTKHGILFMGRDDKIYVRFPDSRAVREISASKWIPLFNKANDVIADAAKGKEPFIVSKPSIDEPKFSSQESTPSKKITEGTANAHVQGRSVLGSLPKPAYNSQAEGIVVVQVKVDQYGTVTEAVPGAEGTTVENKTLWNAARSAALKAHFNQSASAPALQTGTITYIFKLK